MDMIVIKIKYSIVIVEEKNIFIAKINIYFLITTKYINILINSNINA